ncbi:uncharacterized protein Bfra_010861 [Botrytis fragariae]|uniref:Uncharacterized protein n=1 Tax=Botrytis fragariae TaxID=1964551 RepID=A0A8H6ALK7_9HELO|nr:uncharacterized protein Bfra_010861 [Botrytis fragariae]KAF5869664.1 hypothetical protein Bfra_010861 [Botrytis fragariae]
MLKLENQVRDKSGCECKSCGEISSELFFRKASSRHASKQSLKVEWRVEPNEGELGGESDLDREEREQEQEQVSSLNVSSKLYTWCSTSATAICTLSSLHITSMIHLESGIWNLESGFFVDYSQYIKRLHLKIPCICEPRKSDFPIILIFSTCLLLHNHANLSQTRSSSALELFP